MRWLTRSRRVQALWGWAAFLVAATLLLADRVAPLPEMVSHSGIGLPTAIAVPVLVAVLLQSTLASSHPAAELVSTRPLRALDTGLLAVGTGGALAAYGGSAVVRENPLMFASGRNLVGALGLALVCRRVLSPPTASLVVVAYAAVSMMFGDRRHPQVWAFLLAAPGSRWVAVLAAALLVGGVAWGTGRHARLRQLADEQEV